MFSCFLYTIISFFSGSLKTKELSKTKSKSIELSIGMFLGLSFICFFIFNELPAKPSVYCFLSGGVECLVFAEPVFLDACYRIIHLNHFLILVIAGYLPFSAVVSDRFHLNGQILVFLRKLVFVINPAFVFFGIMAEIQ